MKKSWKQRQSGAAPAKDVLGHLIQGLSVSAGIRLETLQSIWTSIVPASVAARARPVALKGGTLWLEAENREAALGLASLGGEILAAIHRKMADLSIERVRFR